MAHKITQVEKGSIADALGIWVDDMLISINNEEILDQIDYQALSALEEIDICTSRNGKKIIYAIEKDEFEPLGLTFEETLIASPRPCHNKCVFCFIDQMPPGLRKSLYVKDDDWRLSLMMGNYVTLTNVSDFEMKRIIKRHASPLYISVHSTDGFIRKKMMNNPTAVNIMEKLIFLKDNGIQFHCQIVLCPGLNDGPVLDKTLQDLSTLYPAAQSVAIVPVGLTKYRNGLEPLNAFNKETSAILLDYVHSVQKTYLNMLGTRFVFPSDEFYCLSQYPLPDELSYENFPQIENGVGLLSLFESSVHYAYENTPLPDVPSCHRTIACGTSVSSHIQKLCNQYAPQNVNVTIVPIYNNFFGHTVTVTGLITGGDLLEQLADIKTDEILICENMLRAEGDLFLDGMSLEEVISKLPAKLKVIRNEGQAFYNAICGLEEV